MAWRGGVTVVAVTLDPLVASLGPASTRAAAVAALEAMGADALPALVRGLSHPDPHVRHWSCRVLDHAPLDAETVARLFASLYDPNKRVRSAALHVLSCDACKPEGECSTTWGRLEPVILRLVQRDPSYRVRRAALTHLIARKPYSTAVRRCLWRVLQHEDDAIMRRRAAKTLAWDQARREEAAADQQRRRALHLMERLLRGETTGEACTVR